MSMLQVKNVSKQFGGLAALDNVNFSVEKEHIHGLIGPNGAGKSTMFKIISGFSSPTAGSIIFNDSSITGLKSSRIAEAGIIRTFQQTTLFHEMTVFENVLIGTHNSSRTNILSALIGSDRKRQQSAKNHAMEAIRFMGLEDRMHQIASELPLGSKRALVIAVALSAKPRLLLLDEPFAGMNPEETNTMMALTEKVRQSGITIILVEHDMKAVMGLCDRLTVLNFGKVLAQGTPKEVRNNPEVINAYLGGGKST